MDFILKRPANGQQSVFHDLRRILPGCFLRLAGDTGSHFLIERHRHIALFDRGGNDQRGNAVGVQFVPAIVITGSILGEVMSLGGDILRSGIAADGAGVCPHAGGRTASRRRDRAAVPGVGVPGTGVGGRTRLRTRVRIRIGTRIWVRDSAVIVDRLARQSVIAVSQFCDALPLRFISAKVYIGKSGTGSERGGLDPRYAVRDRDRLQNAAGCKRTLTDALRPLRNDYLGKQ